jgi:hypothetical protein
MRFRRRSVTVVLDCQGSGAHPTVERATSSRMISATAGDRRARLAGAAADEDQVAAHVVGELVAYDVRGRDELEDEWVMVVMPRPCAAMASETVESSTTCAILGSNPARRQATKSARPGPSRGHVRDPILRAVAAVEPRGGSQPRPAPGRGSH